MDHSAARSRQRPSLRKVVARGAGVGLLFGLGSVIWLSFVEATDVTPPDLLSQSARGSVGGIVISVILDLTRSFRTRGVLQHYCAWVLATFFATLVLLLPAVLSDGWRALLFCLIAGVGGGIGLGLTARQLGGHRY